MTGRMPKLPLAKWPGHSRPIFLILIALCLGMFMSVQQNFCWETCDKLLRAIEITNTGRCLIIRSIWNREPFNTACGACPIDLPSRIKIHLICFVLGGEQTLIIARHLQMMRWVNPPHRDRQQGHMFPHPHTVLIGVREPCMTQNSHSVWFCPSDRTTKLLSFRVFWPFSYFVFLIFRTNVVGSKIQQNCNTADHSKKTPVVRSCVHRGAVSQLRYNHVTNIMC